MQRRLLFFHVPKCGGSSFGAALRLRYLFSQATIDIRRTGAAVRHLGGVDRIEGDYALRGAELVRLVEKGTRCVAGHMRYDPVLHRGAAQGYAHVTLLRDPVERFVSHHRYLCRRHPDPDRPRSLAAFLDTADAPRIGSQYLFYFGGVFANRTADLPAAIARARAALTRFDLVGDLARPAKFAADLRRLVPGPMPVLTRNRAPSPTLVPAELRPRIEQVCAADLEIYTAATVLDRAA